MKNLIIKNGALKTLPALVKKYGTRFVIITDSHLKTQGEALLKAMRGAKLTCHMMVTPPGEHSKSLAMAEKIVRALARLGVARDGCIIGFGGGVVGDLAGFVASIYMRGIAYVAVPTTLLAMTDSSIGGKNGVDLEGDDVSGGKNMLGTFYEPQLIAADPNILTSLPERAYKSGLAENIKHGVIASAPFFKFMAKHAAEILRRSPSILEKMITQSIKIKQAIVAKDARESLSKAKKGTSRMLLNYGHTVGHALEKLSNYELAHGEAVAIGMVAENRVAVGKKLLKEKDALRILLLLKRYGLPTKIPSRFTSQAIKKALANDKKMIDGKLHFALPVRIGKAKIVAL